MSKNEQKLLKEIIRLNKRLVAYETAIDAFPKMAHDLADTIEEQNDE